MENERNTLSAQLSFVEQLRPFGVDEDAHGRIYADLHDLLGAGAWLVQTLAETSGRTLSPSELEDLLVDIDVHFVEHSLFHLSSLRQQIKATLQSFPNSDDDRHDEM